MSHPNPSTAMARVIVDELIRSGVSFAVASPGSRSSALVTALSERSEVDLVVHLDERSAGFRGLGRALASGLPSLIVTTSGSAVANLMPAVVEADRSDIPLILLTADRPLELVLRRANQTMVQPGLFGDYVRAMVAIPEAATGPSMALFRRPMACAADSAASAPAQHSCTSLGASLTRASVAASCSSRASS